jgi:bifunctional aspartokinase / homoserine dehydrogenase 1
MTIKHSWVVHKFGGSSVADASCFRRVADIIERLAGSHTALVLSACKGVTDALVNLIQLAERQDARVSGEIAALRARHAVIAQELLTPAATQLYLAAFDRDCQDLHSILHTVALTRVAGRNVSDLIVGYGELWSSKLMARYLEGRDKSSPIQWLDARAALTVEWGSLGPAVQWEISQRRLAEQVAADFKGILVITGFIASNVDGVQTTLGRNGSDFSASIFGALLSASEIHIWTDVDGVLSADPRRVPEATMIDAMSYNEAMELAYFGAKVLHPQTMAPAVGRDIPIWIRNTFAAEKPGTLISANPRSSLPVKGITHIENIALVNIEGAGMIGVPGTAYRLFGALREADISVVLISQGSSEHSICCAIPQEQAHNALKVIRLAFQRELQEGQIQSVDINTDQAILAVVGDGMTGTPGVAGKVFGALGEAGINIKAIAQGASERNISVVVDGKQATRALRAAHAGFYLSPHTLSIGVIGPGTVGQVFLDQLASQSARLREQFNVDLRVRAVLSSKKMLLAPRKLELQNWRTEFKSHAVTADLAKFVDHVSAEHLPHSVIIDCTASETIARQYSHWLERGVHIVTPNKKANSIDYGYYQKIRETRRKSGAHYLYETTVGAGLPIIHTLRDLRETGDEVSSIEGIFSGTLAYLFNMFDGKQAFSQIVRDAHQRGYTEPDPRDDLSGRDVARKLIILGREIGLKLELEDVKISSLVPPGLENGTIENFLEQLSKHDSAMAERYQQSRARGTQLRFVGRLDAKGTATVGLTEIEAAHPFANIALTDNVVRFVTQRYCNNPLIVQGPGAGTEVTAGGVFADLLRLTTYLGAQL